MDPKHYRAPQEETILWVPTAQRIPIAAGTSVPLSLKKSLVSHVTLFADQLNTATITVGPPPLTVSTLAAPNIAYFQLDAGRDAEIYTDRINVEFFDLKLLIAAHNAASGTMILYLTIYNATNLGFAQ